MKSVLDEILSRAVFNDTPRIRAREFEERAIWIRFRKNEVRKLLRELARANKILMEKDVRGLRWVKWNPKKISP